LASIAALRAVGLGSGYAGRGPADPF